MRRHHLELMHVITVGVHLRKIAKVPRFCQLRKLFIERGGKEIVESSNSIFRCDPRGPWLSARLSRRPATESKMCGAASEVHYILLLFHITSLRSEAEDRDICRR